MEQLESKDSLILGVNNNSVYELSINNEKVCSLQMGQSKDRKILIIVNCFFLFCIILFLFIIFFLDKILDNLWRKAQEKELKDEEVKSVIKTHRKEINMMVYNNVKSSIYKKSGLYYCDILEKVECEDIIPSICLAIMDLIEENEIILMIDNGGVNESVGMFFYKLGNKLMWNQVYKNANGLFEIERDLFWYYPDNVKINDKEINLFNEAFDKYVAYHSNEIIVINES